MYAITGTIDTCDYKNENVNMFSYLLPSFICSGVKLIPDTSADHEMDASTEQKDTSLPPGWTRETRQRKQGKTAGKRDTYIIR